MQSLSYDNSFYSQPKFGSLTREYVQFEFYERLCIRTRFETEAKGNEGKWELLDDFPSAN